MIFAVFFFYLQSVQISAHIKLLEFRIAAFNSCDKRWFFSCCGWNGCYLLKQNNQARLDKIHEEQRENVGHCHPNVNVKHWNVRFIAMFIAVEWILFQPRYQSHWRKKYSCPIRIFKMNWERTVRASERKWKKRKKIRRIDAT